MLLTSVELISSMFRDCRLNWIAESQVTGNSCLAVNIFTPIHSHIKTSTLKGDFSPEVEKNSSQNVPASPLSSRYIIEQVAILSHKWYILHIKIHFGLGHGH